MSVTKAQILLGLGRGKAQSVNCELSP